MPAPCLIIGIENDSVVVRFFAANGLPSQDPRPIASRDELAQYVAEKATESKVAVNDLEIYYSSSMDYPEEETDNAKTLALVAELR